jgi:hypothetical protein
MKKDKDLDFSKRRASKEKKDEILKELLRMARDLHVGVEFRFNEFDEMGGFLDGCFDPTNYTIKIYRPLKEKVISVYSLFVLAHEIFHAIQYRDQLKPDAWLYYQGLTHVEPEEDCEWLEDDADARAAKFINQYL